MTKKNSKYLDRYKEAVDFFSLSEEAKKKYIKQKALASLSPRLRKLLDLPVEKK